MPPAVRRASVPEAGDALAAQTDVLLAWAATADLDAPTAVGAWTARDVLWHLAQSAEGLLEALGDRAAQPGELAAFLASYEHGAAEVAAQPRERTGDPREALASATAAVSDALRAGAPLVVPLFGDPLRLSDAIVSRVIEAVVHGDDLGIAPDRNALAVTVRALTGVMAVTHPGKAVELRVAPFSAVQILEGTVHRRGTPTAVVSAEPLAWLRLATGRLAWADATATGAVVASGERSDLSPLLPLLR